LYLFLSWVFWKISICVRSRFHDLTTCLPDYRKFTDDSSLPTVQQSGETIPRFTPVLRALRLNGVCKKFARLAPQVAQAFSFARP
jgi:hypothetical protein